MNQTPPQQAPTLINNSFGGNNIPTPTMIPTQAPAQAPVSPIAPSTPTQISSSPAPAPTGQTLDPDVINLTKAIRQVESGGNFQATGASGEYGAYQFEPETWNAIATKYLGQAVPLSQATPQQQNEVAYKQVSDWKAAGYNVGQIASMWNAGKGAPNAYLQNHVGTNKGVAFNTPQYAQNVAQAYQTIKASSGGQAGAPASSGSTPAPSVGGFVGNVFGSAGNLLGGLGNLVMHPIKSTEGIIGTVAGAGEAGLNKLGLTDFNNQDTQDFGNMVSYFKNRYGGDSLSQVIGNIGNTLYTDPVGAALDLSTFIDGVGGAIGAAAKISKVAELSDLADTLHTTASAINPVTQVAGAAGAVAKPIGALGSRVLNSAISHSTGFNPETISTIASDPAAFSKAAMEETSRGGVLTDVTNGLNKLENQYEETGQQYNAIRSAAGTVSLPENFLEDILEKGTTEEGDTKSIPFGLHLEPVMPKEEEGVIQTEEQEPIGYKVVADSNSKTRNPADIAAVQKFVDNWGGKSELTPQEFLNMRNDAKDMAKFGRDVGTNRDASLVGKAIRAQLNKNVRPQIPGLQKLDETAAPQIATIQKVTKDLYGKDGELKDNAASKVANALNKEGLMKRLETVSPGITAKLNSLRAIEDIEKAEGIKVGNYARSTGEILAVATGHIPLLIGALLTHPAIALKMIRAFGISKAAMVPILGKARALLGALPKDALQFGAQAAIISNRANP